jgi:type IV pilus assembly protein PilE
MINEVSKPQQERLVLMYKKTTHQFGFTLIELMITVAIVSVLATVGMGSYTTYITKSRRADAQAVLLNLAQFMERVYTENNTYKPGGNNPTLPYTESPIDGSSKYYNLTLSASTATSFTLRATPKNSQAGDGFLEITNLGTKAWDKDNGGSIGSGENSW